ncbi:MAG: PIN domain-containing protein [Pseudonocardia sp.]|nr:PIN domain-containing protein [Pseudonocardia sp.]
MIFVDTSFWVALRQRRDAHHEHAVTLWPLHADRSLLTTNHVRGETWTFLRRRSGHAAATDFLDGLSRSARVRVLHVAEDVERRALRWLRSHDEREYSFVDATSFATMKAHRVTEALAFDGDFAAAGYVELRP